MVNNFKAQILFLYETRNTASWLDMIHVRFSFRGCLDVDKVGKGGGLALLWSGEVDLSISSYSARHIDAMISYESQQLRIGMFSRIYCVL